MKTASSEMLSNLGTEMWSGAAMPQQASVFAQVSPQPAPPPRLSLAAQRRMRRLTIDVAVDLHCRMKSACARQGVKMTDVLREFLETRFPD